jgi:hypothetical protein
MGDHLPLMTILLDLHPTEVLNNLPRVDYDDTGFVPRFKLEADLKKKILGRHPVVTVLGEGGNGKSALTLQTAYRLLNSNDHNFDAIIWVSAKATILTLQEIVRKAYDFAFGSAISGGPASGNGVEQITNTGRFRRLP